MLNRFLPAFGIVLLSATPVLANTVFTPHRAVYDIKLDRSTEQSRSQHIATTHHAASLVIHLVFTSH